MDPKKAPVRRVFALSSPLGLLPGLVLALVIAVPSGFVGACTPFGTSYRAGYEGDPDSPDDPDSPTSDPDKTLIDVPAPGDSITATPPGPKDPLVASRAFPRLGFNQPVAMLWPKGDSSHVFVAEKTGRILSFEAKDDVLEFDVAMDLTLTTNAAIPGASIVAAGPLFGFSFEEGILGMVAHPAFGATKREFYIYYDRGTGPATYTERVSRFKVASDGRTIDVGSEEVLVEIKRAKVGRNGGGLVFGNDGFLYVGVSDGGLVRDPAKKALDKNNLAGKILRLDVNNRDKGKTYAIPGDNPFVTPNPKAPARAEVFSWGHGSPSHLALDEANGRIFETELGEGTTSELNVLAKSGNFGWGVKDAYRIVDPAGLAKVVTAGETIVDPAIELSQPVGSPIVGGVVYRGAEAGLQRFLGHYIFGDFSTGDVVSLEPKLPAGPVPEFTRTVLARTGHHISALATGPAGELMAVDRGSGVLLRISENLGAAPKAPYTPVLLFLNQDGVGTRETGSRYYDSIGATPDLTLSQWESDNLGPQSTWLQSFYQNVGDLGFFREMRCSQTITAGKGGCAVTNWKSPEEKQRFAQGDRTVRNLGTVCMNISTEGYTRFYIFDDRSELTPVAPLDFEGEKVVPQLCTPCHGGKYDAAKGPDMSTMFREFEPSWLKEPPGKLVATQQNEWFLLNRVMKGANQSLKSKDLGVQETFRKAVDYVDAMYPGANATTRIAKPIGDVSHVPSSWKKVFKNPLLTAANTKLYTSTVGTYCQQCHRTNSIDFSDYSAWDKVSKITAGKSDLERMIGDRFLEIDEGEKQLALLTTDEERQKVLDSRQKPMMPTANRTRQLLLGDTVAQGAIDAWLFQRQDEDRAIVRARFEVVTRNDLLGTGQTLAVVGSLRQLGLDGTEEVNGKLKDRVKERFVLAKAPRYVPLDLGNGTSLHRVDVAIPFGGQFRWFPVIVDNGGTQVRAQCTNTPLAFNDTRGLPIFENFAEAKPTPTLATLTPEAAVITMHLDAPAFDTTFHDISQPGDGNCAP